MSETVLSMARATPAPDARERRALHDFARRVTIMRRKLDSLRRGRAIRRLTSYSMGELMPALAALPPCQVCGWAFGTNPLRCCSAGFGCSLDCLRYKSCEWKKGLIPPLSPLR